MKAFTPVERCRRDIIQLICTSGLREGEQLPPQSALCARFQMGNRTLSEAMLSLVDMGLLSRKTRTGTVIADLTALERMPWTIGVSSINAPDYGQLAFFAILHHQIISQLARANCRGVTFFRNEQFHSPHQIKDFPGLSQACDGHQIDGLILQTNLNRNEWNGLTRQGIAVSHVGPIATVASGIVIDYAGFVTEATKVLQQRGCRHIVIADNLLLPDLKTICAAGEGGRIERLCGGSELQGGRELGQELLRRPHSERPHGVLVIDDHVAMGLAEVLKQTDTHYRPQIACVTNRQLPLSYALPVMEWKLDVQELADLAVSHIRSKLLGRVAADEVQYGNLRANPQIG